jgi:hypothetical protein
VFVDEQKNDIKAENIKLMKDKSKCVDMFAKLQLDGNHVYDQ